MVAKKFYTKEQNLFEPYLLTLKWGVKFLTISAMAYKFNSPILSLFYLPDKPYL